MRNKRASHFKASMTILNKWKQSCPLFYFPFQGMIYAYDTQENDLSRISNVEWKE